MEKNDLGLSIIEGASNSEAKDLTVEFGELALDALLDEGVLKEVPVLKSLIAFVKTGKAIHEQLFLRKVCDFLRTCPKFSEAEKENFARGHLSDAKKAKKLGDAVLLILDKLDDLEKPQLLAKVFAALVRGKIGLETFRRLAAAIDIGFVVDLNQLAGATEENPPAHSCLSNLFRTGLIRLRPGSQGGNLPIYALSDLGKSFVQCMKELG